MVMLVNSRCIAIYYIIKIVCCSSSEGAINIVYANELQRANMDFRLPKPFNRDISVLHTRENGLQENVVFFRKDLSVQSFKTWKLKVEAFFNHEGYAGFTIKSALVEDAGKYVCKGEGGVTYPGCWCLLVVIVKPNRPVISPLSETSYQCKHSSRSRPSSHVLDHTTKWLDSSDTELGVNRSDKYSINDKGELQVNNEHASDKGLTFKCQTADVVENATDIMLQFSDPSDEFVFKGLPKATTPTETSIIKPTTADTSTNNSSMPKDLPRLINDGSSPISLITTFAVLFVFVFVMFGAFHLLLKKKTALELHHVPEFSESAIKAQIPPAAYQIH